MMRDQRGSISVFLAVVFLAFLLLISMCTEGIYLYVGRGKAMSACMAGLSHVRGNYQKDLEAVLNLRRATVSGVLQTMERNGLVLRVVNDGDARSKKIILNEKAKKIFASNEKKIAELEKIAVRGIPDDELAIFSKVLSSMKNNLKSIDK